MKKEEFFAALAAGLSAMSEQERAGVLEYYEEIICDEVEHGVSEEDVLADLGDPVELARRVMEEAENLARTGERPQEPEERVFSAVQPVRELVVRAENVRVQVERVSDGPVRVRFTPVRGEKVSVVEENGVFTFRHTMSGMRLFSLGLSELFKEPRCVLVQLPPDFTGTLSVTTSNARVEGEDLGSMGDAEFVTSNARVVLSGLQCGALRVKTTNGSLELYSARGSTCIMSTNNAKVTVEDALFPVRMELYTGNGTISVARSGSDDLRFTTSNASIRAALIGDGRTYSIRSRTSNGKNNLPPDWPCPGSEKRLEVTTSNAKIDVTFSL